MKNIDAVVACGGWGRRMGHIMNSHKCKSLVPVLGLPSLIYVLEALKRVNCSKCILSLDRPELYHDIERLAVRSGLPFIIHMDPGHGPTTVACEAAKQVSTPRFLMLYGHQIVFPDHLARMIEADRDFIATVYENSSERIRKIATLSPSGRCIRLRRGSADNPAQAHEQYLDVPYVLQTTRIRDSKLSKGDFDPKTPADQDLRPNTILRFVRNLHTIPAKFRHEYHYENEIFEVEQIAKQFQNELII